MNFRALPGWKGTSLPMVSESTHHDNPVRRPPDPYVSAPVRTYGRGRCVRCRFWLQVMDHEPGGSGVICSGSDPGWLAGARRSVPRVWSGSVRSHRCRTHHNHKS